LLVLWDHIFISGSRARKKKSYSRTNSTPRKTQLDVMLRDKQIYSVGLSRSMIL